MVEEVTRDLVQLLGVAEEDIIAISAKTGVNVDKVLEAVAQRVPAPPEADKESLCARWSLTHTTIPIRA